MPGIPTSRGCDACRKQRKKCDQAQPSCARCARLGLDCTGAGVRRFIFVDKSSGRGTPKQDAKRSKLIHHASSNYPSPIIRPVSPNSHDSLLSLLVSKLATKDLRYDIAWAYGSFMTDIPKRLGHSIALDSATRALTLSLPPSPQARKQPSMDALQNYTAALEATRLALADPVQSKSINTVCAVYFLLLCQDRNNVPDDIFIHVAGISHMLNNPEVDFDPLDAFEAGLVALLCFVMKAEMLLDTKFEAMESSRCWSFYNTFVAQSAGSRPCANPDLALALELSTLVSGLSSLLHTVRPPSEVLSYYNALSLIALNHRTRLAEVRTTLAVNSPTSNSSSNQETSEEIRSYVRLIRSYGLSLTIGLVTNIILRMYFPSKESELAQTSWHFACELASLATEAAQFKPLGSMFTANFLNTAWAVCDETSREELLVLLASNQVDFDIGRAKILSEKLDHSFDVLRGRVAEHC